MKKLFYALDEKPLTTLETILAIVSAFLGGMVIGLLLSPKGDRNYGCNSGNNNGNYYGEEE